MRNVFDKEKFVIHYENLQFYLRLGLKLKEIHRVLELNQSKLAKAEKMVTKIVQINEKHCVWKNNQNLRKRITVKLVNNKKRLFKMDIQTCNQFHNILRLFDVLPNFTFTSSEMMGDY